MKGIKRIILTLLMGVLLVFGLGLEYFVLMGRGSQSELIFRGDAYGVEQGVKERAFKDADCRKIFTTSESLFIPTKVKVKNNLLYVLDFGDLKVKRFSPYGKFLEMYGKGKGKGPGEFLNPTDFVVDDNLNIWVNDPYLMSITVIGADNSIRKTFRAKNMSMKICLAKERVILMRAISLEYLFDIYSYNGDYLYSIGSNLLPEQSNPGFSLLLGGDIDCDSEFLYGAFDRLNYLFGINLKDGGLKFLVKTIDDITPPKIKVIDTKDGPIYKVEEDREFSALSMNLVGNEIFITSGKNWKSRDSVTYVDVYSSVDGRYLYSFKIPGKFRRGYFDGRYYYGVGDTIVSKFEVLFR